jgi:hypothetical protein
VARAEPFHLRRAARIGAALALAALTACSADLAGYSTIVTQDKFDFMSCAQITGNRAALMGREQELSGLVAKAEASPGGIIASFAAYRSELSSTRTQIVVVNRAAQRNGCDAPRKP